MGIDPGITVDPSACLGQPCVAETRVDVATVVGTGESMAAVQEACHLES